ncbi:codanin-1-like [Ornithodoros turicata]|uniref:codanin-1-like n=1 Tax=Ornithodoros turicata TaxID=34597 RepID=UPI003138B935
MAAILELLFNGKLLPGELSRWLDDPKCMPSCSDFSLVQISKHEFLTFFVNHVREQASVHQQQCSDSSERGAKQQRKCRTTSARTTPPGKPRTTESAHTKSDSSDRTKTTPGSNKGCTPPSDKAKRNDKRISPHSGNAIQHENARNVQVLRQSKNPPNIGDPNAFPTIGLSQEKQKHVRRITPTPVKHQRWRKLTVSDFLPPEIPHESPRANERDLLKNSSKLALLKPEISISSSKATQSASQRTPMKKMTLRTVSKENPASDAKAKNAAFDVDEEPVQSGTDVLVVNYIVPSPDKVTFQNRLDILIELYSDFVKSAHVTNITIELYFLLQLLTIRSQEPPDQGANSDLDTLLGNPHNRAYFAVGVLRIISPWLRFLDKPTLKLLSEIDHLAAFSKRLQLSLHELCLTTQPTSRVLPSSIEAVPFQMLTDNKENFSSEKNFWAFRKQRDMFYDLFRDWQQQQFYETGHNSEVHFARRVEQILDTCIDPCNYSHFARLLLTQLVTSCCGGLQVDEQGNFGEQFLSELRNKSPDKFKKLEGRLAFKVEGPCPTPAFTGCQEFFYNFIAAASKVTFHQHLKDQFVARIVELDEEEFDVTIGAEGKEAFFVMIHELKLLGKFMGLLEFLPHRSEERMSSKHVELQRKVRNHAPLPLSIATMLTTSAKRRRLVFTLSWVVDYLSMMDQVAKTLDSYKEVLSLLYCIYTSPEVRKVTGTSFYVRVTLGWLFDIINVQPSIFSSSSSCIDVGPDVAEELIDQQLIHTSCPYLSELRGLLVRYSAGNRARGSEVRKITPISARDAEFGDCTPRRLDRQLEENFFHVQPQFVKKTVEFVSERVASNAVTFIKKNATNMIKDSAGDNNKEVTRTFLAQVREGMEATIHDVCAEQISQLLSLLLSHDSEAEVVEICHRLALRSAVGRVSQWVYANVSDSFILRHASSPVPNEKENVGASCDRIIDGVELSRRHSNARSIYGCLDMLRTKVANLYAGDSAVSAEESLAVLLSCHNSLQSRRECVALSRNAVEQLTLDFVLALIVRCPQSCSDELFNFAAVMWRGSETVGSLLQDIICVRNVQLLRMSRDAAASWSKLGDLILKLASAGVIDDLESVYESVRVLGGTSLSENEILERLCLKVGSVLV